MMKERRSRRVYNNGQTTLNVHWPSLMVGLWEDEPRYKQHFRFQGWFLTGDMVTKDEEGYYFYDGRNDSLIKVGMKDTGPYELEQILTGHQAVAVRGNCSEKPQVKRRASKSL